MQIEFFTIAVLTLLMSLGSFSFAHNFYERNMLFYTLCPCMKCMFCGYSITT